MAGSNGVQDFGGKWIVLRKHCGVYVRVRLTAWKWLAMFLYVRRVKHVRKTSAGKQW